MKEVSKAEENGYAQGMFYTVQDKAWMDEKKMLEWIDKVWAPFCAERPITMLILDEATCHLTGKVRRKIEGFGTVLEFIPGGYTSKLQVMDVGLNKPFKEKMRDHFDMYQVETNCTKPSRQDVSKWIKGAWDGITQETILNTWIKVW